MEASRIYVQQLVLRETKQFCIIGVLYVSESMYVLSWKLVSMFQDKLADSAYKILMDYHTATVALLALMSAATGDVS